MSDTLHGLTKVLEKGPHSLKARVRLLENLSDFDGHFPDQKILPGVVQLDLIQRLAEDWLGKRLRMISIPQLKFVRPLKPKDDVQITLEFEETEDGYIVIFSFGS